MIRSAAVVPTPAVFQTEMDVQRLPFAETRNLPLRQAEIYEYTRGKSRDV